MKNFWQKTVFLLALAGLTNFVGLAQTAVKTECPDEKAAKAAKSEKDWKFNFAVADALSDGDEPPSEKAILTDANVAVSLCVAEGEVSVRGWERKEVRAMVTGGRVGFKVMQRNEEDKPEWLMIVNVDKNGKINPAGECLRGENIEIELPYGASVDIKSGSRSGHEGDWSFDSLTKVTAANISGNILLRNIKQRIEASSLQGNIAAEDSGGEIYLKSLGGGSIAAVRLKPITFSDALKIATTSGDVVLRDVKHKSIAAKTLSGELSVYNPQRGGNYNFDTNNGSVSVYIPPDFPFQFKATIVGKGYFESDFTMQTENTHPGKSRVIVAINGEADTPINMSAFTGTLRLKKKAKN